MTRRGSLTAAALAAGMICVAVPAIALAATTTPEPRWIVVSPTSGLPGAKVSVQVACVDDKFGTVDSDALTVGPLTRNPDGHQPWALFASGTVKAGAAPGKHAVSTTCGGQKVTTTFTVAVRQVRQVPTGAPQTGGGGLAAQVGQ